MSIGFIWPVLAGCILAIPAAWVYIGHWLGKYPERVDNAAWLYIAALVAILLVVILTISCQATRLMNTNPASELKKKYFGPEGELFKKRASLMTPIQEEIYNAVKDIADLRGYQLVLDRASDTGIIFGSPKVDISNEVLEKLGYGR